MLVRFYSNICLTKTGISSGPALNHSCLHPTRSIYFLFTFSQILKHLIYIQVSILNSRFVMWSCISKTPVVI